MEGAEEGTGGTRVKSVLGKKFVPQFHFYPKTISSKGQTEIQYPFNVSYDR